MQSVPFLLVSDGIERVDLCRAARRKKSGQKTDTARERGDENKERERVREKADCLAAEFARRNSEIPAP